MNTGIKTILTFLFVFGLLHSCSKEKSSSNSQISSLKKIDSITAFINQSVNSSLGTKETIIALEQSLNLINSLEQDSLRMKYFSDLSYKSISIGDSLFFRKVNLQTQKLASVLKDSSALAEAQWDLAIYFNQSNLKDSAYYYYNNALTIHSKLNNPNKIANLLYAIATVQTAVGDFSSAEQNTIKSLELYKALNNYNGLYLAYNSLGNISNSVGEYNRAIEFYNTAKTYLDEVENSESDKISITNNIGVSYNYLENYESAERNFQMVVNADSLKFKNPDFYAKALTNLATCKMSLNSSENIEPLFAEAIQIQQNENNSFSEATTVGYYAKYLAFKGDTLIALEKAKKSVALAEKSNNTEGLLRSLDFLTIIDKPNASKYAQQYIVVNEKLQKDERTLRDKFARVRFQTDEFIEKNELLANQNKLLTREKQLWSAISVIGLITAIAILVIVLQRIRNRNLKFKQLQQESNQEIFNLLLLQQGKLEEGKKLEQERISQELHDGVLNKMLGIRLVLIGLNKKTDQESIDQRAELIKDLAELSEEIRAVSHELSNAAYQNVSNFIESIKALIETFRKATPEINFNFAYTEEFGWDNILSETKIHLYRIAQESIQNCIKHAQASTIFLNFEATDKEIVVSIEDNGKGFDSNKAKKGIGFRNISSRVRKMNGIWDLSSTLGEGTILTIKVPLTESKNKVA
ncbi:tetratricopeptide repeat-containing sensor histidine kinase [Cellulophaga tyrosinoxydans]|uniref:Oxygen sensor histidine kinase NreB n=1 Tax=Cellulophaga tyrosinoxydans TaxID=504486 RepID=A0A1W1ZPQ6_9FLAO|nr:sensor histidine kinase [Cellulophaga tyrosinoxydans]SMC50535.1 Histidine kinase [Cellulophaga tyrosinoxydans]